MKQIKEHNHINISRLLVISCKCDVNALIFSDIKILTFMILLKKDKNILINNKNILNYSKIQNNIMDPQKTISSKGLIKFLIIVFKAIYYLLWFCIVVVLILEFVSLRLIFDSVGFPIPIDFTVYFSLSEELGVTTWDINGGSSFSINYAIGSIKLSKVPNQFMALYCLMAFALFVLMLFSARLIIKILKTVRDNSFLLIENALRLRWIALLGIAILFADKIMSYTIANYLSRHIEYSGVKFTGINTYIIQNVDSIFSSLFLLVIAEVFRIGAKLKEEQELTI